MKYYIFSFPAKDNNEPIYQLMSDKAILGDYWEYWSYKMKEAGRFADSEPKKMEQMCIEDFCMVHWAEELDAKWVNRFLDGLENG